MSDNEDSAEMVRVEPQVVEYCPSCSFPPEFCEFGNKWDKCQSYLKKSHPDLLEKFQALRIASGKVDEPVKESDTKDTKEDGEDDEDDEDEDDEEEEEVKSSAKVVKPVLGDKKEIVIYVKERTRRKRITLVQGVETCGIKVKELVKALSKKFATSASDTDEGISLNGELDRDIAEYLLQQYPNDVTREIFYTTIKGG